MKTSLTAFLGFGNTEWILLIMSLACFLFISWIVVSFFRGFYRK